MENDLAALFEKGRNIGISASESEQVLLYIDQLTEKIKGANRIREESKQKLKDFLSLCDIMELVPKDELEIAEQARSLPPADQRARQIARCKRQKAAESKLLEIKERKERRGRSSKASALSTPVEVGEEDEMGDYGEDEREAWVSTITLAVCKALDLLDMLKKEEDMFGAVRERQSKTGEEEFSAWHPNEAGEAYEFVEEEVHAYEIVDDDESEEDEEDESSSEEVHVDDEADSDSDSDSEEGGNVEYKRLTLRERRIDSQARIQRLELRLELIQESKAYSVLPEAGRMIPADPRPPDHLLAEFNARKELLVAALDGAGGAGAGAGANNQGAGAGDNNQGGAVGDNNQGGEN